MTHRIDIRIPEEIYKELRKQPGTMTSNICTALHTYMHTDNVQEPYTKTMIDILQEQIAELHQDKTFLQSQINALMVTRNPTLKEWITYRLKGNHKQQI